MVRMRAPVSKKAHIGEESSRKMYSAVNLNCILFLICKIDHLAEMMFDVMHFYLVFSQRLYTW
jgi:hypothetical protein